MWAAYVVFAVGAVALTLWRYRDPFHPCLLLLLALILHLLGDFILMPGQSEVLAYIPPHRLTFYRGLVLVVVAGTWLLMMAIARNWQGASYRAVPLPRPVGTAIGGVALALSGGSQLFLLSLVGFDIEAYLGSLLESRGGKPWSVDGFVLTHPLLHLAPVLYTTGAGLALYLAIAGRAATRAGGLFIFLATFPLVISNGSRTLLFVLGGFGVVAAMLHLQRRLSRYVLLLCILAALIVGASVQIRTRDYGFGAFFDDFGAALLPVVHFDDTHSRLLRALYLVEEHGIRWDAGLFFRQLILNFVPRWFWPERPLLDEAFFGEIKVFYVTISALGDFVATLGLSAGIAAFVGLVVLFLYALGLSHRAIQRPLGLIVHLLVALYAYNALRSLHGLVAFFYYTAIGILAVWVSRKASSWLASVRPSLTRSARVAHRGANKPELTLGRVRWSKWRGGQAGLL